MAQDKNIEFLDRMRQLITQGELPIVIEQVLGYLRGGSQELYNEAVLLASRSAAIATQVRRGLITAESASAQRNSLVQSTLEFLDQISRTVSRWDLPVSASAVDFAAPPPTPLEKIFGANHLKTITWLQRGMIAAASVCRVVTPNGLGTGFLIGPDRLMTNHHVISSANVARESWAEFNYQENLDQSLGPVYKYRMNAESVRVSAMLDYCVAELTQDSANPPLEKWGFLALSSTQDVRPGDHVPIIQHPQGGLKQIAVTANQVANVFDHRLQYMTDTLPGSSGSPVFNDDWIVIAIHHAGGNLLTNSRGDRMFANEGILMNYIQKDLGWGQTR